MLRHESLPRPMPLKYAVPFWMSGVFSIVFYIANLVVDVQGTCAWDQGHCRKRQNAFNGPILWFLRSVRCSVWGARMVSFLHPGLMAFPRRCTACVPTRQSTCKQRVHDIRSTEGSAKMLSVGMVSSLHLGLMVFPQRCTACVPTRQTANVGTSVEADDVYPMSQLAASSREAPFCTRQRRFALSLQPWSRRIVVDVQATCAWYQEH
ncbi:uncharacterized protein LOC142589914 isoform X5 [Dermacentor variabilis]|uniref:uncharacterized protein LOC142589914 isoform X5 n=1 Tax=Dermacentor variabilis TaxID=34621 RepID=UPI003F5C8D6E